MIRHFTTADGRRLAYRDSGKGPVVLCLAGLTRDARDFTVLADHLESRFRVLRLDSRGRGDSAWADEPVQEYTVPVEAADALALLDHLQIARAAVVGTSRGGLLGMVLGATPPERLTALILNDVGPAIEPAGLDAIMSYLGLEPRADSFEAAAQALQAAMGADFPDVAAPRWLAFARSLYRDDAGRPRLSYDPRLRDAVTAAMAGPLPDLWPLFDALAGLPVLTVRGANSNIFAAATLSEMARRRPDMTHVTLPNRGHVPFLDEPQALGAIGPFLETHAR